MKFRAKQIASGLITLAVINSVHAQSADQKAVESTQSKKLNR